MRVVVAALAVMLIVPVGPIAVAAVDGQSVREQVYQGILCSFLKAVPYLAGVPEDVSCDYEARPLTHKEARAYYVSVADEVNEVGYRWNCAHEKAKNGLTWKQHRKWNDRSLVASVHMRSRLASVLWPAELAADIEATRSQSRKSDRAMDAVHSRRSFERAVAAGDWARLQKAKKKQAATVVKVRSALSLPDPSSDACKRVRQYDRERADT